MPHAHSTAHFAGIRRSRTCSAARSMRATTWLEKGRWGQYVPTMAHGLKQVDLIDCHGTRTDLLDSGLRVVSTTSKSKTSVSMTTNCVRSCVGRRGTAKGQVVCTYFRRTSLRQDIQQIVMSTDPIGLGVGSTEGCAVRRDPEQLVHALAQNTKESCTGKLSSEFTQCLQARNASFFSNNGHLLA